MAYSVKAPHEMVFGWCKNGKHDACRVRYGDNRIVCSCDAPECADVHGKNYVSFGRVMSQAEVDHADRIIKNELVATTQSSLAENRAIMPTSSIWGEQISNLAEFDEEGSDEWYSRYDKGTNTSYGGYKSVLQEIQDAASIQELEARRLARW